MRRIRVFRALVVLASFAAAVALGVACSSNETTKIAGAGDAAAADAEPDVVEIEPVDAAPPECKLSVGTGVMVCDDCLQKRCCVVVNACFDDKPCEALNNCINDCGARLGRGDAGVQCVRECAKGKDEPATKVYDMLECQGTRCGPDCK